MKCINSKIILFFLLSLLTVGCDNIHWGHNYYYNPNSDLGPGYETSEGAAGIRPGSQKKSTKSPCYSDQDTIGIHTDHGVEYICKSDLEKKQQDLAENSYDSTLKNSIDNPEITTDFELYKVKQGDTFWKIAHSRLGSGHRFKEIVKLNPKVDMNSLKPGLFIKIPRN